jgi:hypothetical protein
MTNDPKHQQPAPPAPELTEVRYDFTEGQLETLAPVLEELQYVQNKLAFFLNHVVREAKLPKARGGYDLQFDGDKTPYLLGRVAKDGKKQ